MINPDRVKEGDVLWDCHKTRMGNTTMTRMGCWQVRVLRIEDVVDGDGSSHRVWTVSWNGNRSELYYESDIARLRRSPIKGAT